MEYSATNIRDGTKNQSLTIILNYMDDGNGTR